MNKHCAVGDPDLAQPLSEVYIYTPVILNFVKCNKATI